MRRNCPAKVARSGPPRPAPAYTVEVDDTGGILKAAFYAAMLPALGEMSRNYGQSLTPYGPDGGRTRTHLQHISADSRGKSRRFCGIEVLALLAYSST